MAYCRKSYIFAQPPASYSIGAVFFPQPPRRERERPTPRAHKRGALAVCMFKCMSGRQTRCIRGWRAAADARGEREVRFSRAPLACSRTGSTDIRLVASHPQQRLKEGVRSWAGPTAPSTGIGQSQWTSPPDTAAIPSDSMALHTSPC